MAKIINSEVESQVLSSTYYLWRVILIGIFLGLLYWLFTVFIEKYIIGAFLCNSSFSNLICLDLVLISGNIASIIIAVISTLVMLKLGLSRPLVVAVAVMIALWGLSSWTIGLSTGEIILGDVVTYFLAYLLFSWIARYMKTVTVLITIFIVIIMVRIAVNL